MKKSFIKVLFTESFRMINASKRLFFLCIILSFFNAILSFSYIFLLGRLIEVLTNYETRGIVFFIFTIFALTVILKEVFNGIINYYLDKQQMIIAGKLKIDLFNKIGKLNVLEFEKPEILNAMEKAKNGVNNSVQSIMHIELIIANSFVYIILLLFYMSSINPLLIIVVLGVFIPTLLSYILKNKYMSESEDESAIYSRRMDKYVSFITDREFFKETRHLGNIDYFKYNFDLAADNFKKIKNKEIVKLTWLGVITDLSQFLGFLSIFLVVYFLVKSEQINAGIVVSIIATINLLFSHVTELFNFHITGVANSYVGLRYLNTIMSGNYLDYKDNLNEKNKRIRKINLKNVYFSYPNTDILALDNINLEINAGEIICIVGKNGSGKSTLAKILLGLYPINDGKILINEMEDSSNNIKLKNNSSAVFQNFNKYNITFEENIKLGDINKSNNFISKGIKELGETLPEGFNTMLSKKFNGIDLSEGQWQRLAIERGLFKEADMVVLDEPTSSIDPLLEMELLNSLLNNKNNSIKIIITHRIGIATKADKIFLMEDGKLIESGNHKDLMIKDNKYRKLFSSQSQWYE